MSMSRKIEPASHPLQTGWTKAALLAVAVIAYQVLVYCMVVYQPDGGLGEGLMAAPLLAAAGRLKSKLRKARNTVAIEAWEKFG